MLIEAKLFPMLSHIKSFHINAGLEESWVFQVIILITVEYLVTAGTFILAEGNGSTTLVPGWITTWAIVDHSTAAHFTSCIHGSGITTFVVLPVAIRTAVDGSIATHEFPVVKARRTTALVVNTGHTVGVRAWGDVSIATH